jgi:hypothetical protein
VAPGGGLIVFVPLMENRMPYSQETTNALADARLDALEDKVKELTDDRDRALKWGILTLGSAVLGLGTWVFNFISGHLK